MNVVLIGSPKSGKSTGAASAPGKVLYLNADLPTATRFARLRYGDKVQEIEYEGVKTLTDVAHEVYDPKTQFKTVVVDPVGELFRLLLEEEAKGAVRPTLNQYGDVGANLERFCRALCKAPINAVFITHDHPVKDEASGEIVQLPWTGTTNPKLGRQLLGMVDVVGFTGVVQKQDGERLYVASLVQAKGRAGGDRFNVLAGPDGWRPLDLSEWLATVQESEQPIEEKEAA
jgi:hypothetical protein